MRCIVEALRGLRVPVCVIADFDVLRDDATLRRLVGSLGGDWPAVEDDWRKVVTAVSEKNDSPLVDTVRETVNELLSDAAEARMTRELSRSVKEAARTRDGWQQANEVGLPAVPQGNAVVACRRLLDSLKGIGLFVVETGEVESFARDVGGHGPAWVIAALEQDKHRDPNGLARQFVTEIVASLVKMDNH